MKKTTPPPKPKNVWTCRLVMTLADEKTAIAREVDMDGHACEVIDQLITTRNDVTEAVEQAVNSIIASAQGFGIRRDGK